MKYILLIHPNDSSSQYETMSEEERQAIFGEYVAIGQAPGVLGRDQLQAALIGFLGDFALAEEAAQDAFATAAERWPRTGVPDNPGAWLVTTARNRAIDRIRRDRVLATKTRMLEVPEVDESVDETAFPDE